MHWLNKSLFVFVCLLSFVSYSQENNGLPPLFLNANTIENAPNLKHLFRNADSSGVKQQTIKILHIGDSHVKSGLFAETFVARVNHYLQQQTQLDTATFTPPVLLKVMAKNGATVKSFIKEIYVKEAISAFNPDIIFISFGTNEATNKYRLDTLTFYFNQLVEQLKRDAPQANLIFTTPGDCMRKVTAISYRKKKAVRTTHFQHNYEVEMVRNFLKLFTASNNVALWDWYKVMGEAHAINRWQAHGLAKGDKVHLTAAGYRLQGNLLADAFIKLIQDINNSHL